MIQSLRREPLVHFLLIAVLLFTVDAVLNADPREAIRVDGETLDFLVEKRAQMSLHEVSEQERAQLLAAYIDDEVLVREAYERGLDKGGRIRRQLVMQMRTLLAEDPPEPTQADLRAFYAAQAERYGLPERISFQHLFFNLGDEIPVDLAARLEAAADPPNLGVLDPVLGRFPMQRSQRELSLYLGEAAAAALLAIDDDQWHGPISSRRGVHFVRVTEHLPQQQPAFEAIAPYLVQDWQLSRQKAGMADTLAELREKYRIIKPDAGT